MKFLEPETKLTGRARLPPSRSIGIGLRNQLFLRVRGSAGASPSQFCFRLLAVAKAGASARVRLMHPTFVRPQHY